MRKFFRNWYSSFHLFLITILWINKFSFKREESRYQRNKIVYPWDIQPMSNRTGLVLQIILSSVSGFGCLLLLSTEGAWPDGLAACNGLWVEEVGYTRHSPPCLHMIGSQEMVDIITLFEFQETLQDNPSNFNKNLWQGSVKMFLPLCHLRFTSGSSRHVIYIWLSGGSRQRHLAAALPK